MHRFNHFNSNLAFNIIVQQKIHTKKTMSIQQRRNIAYWFLLIAGIALISMQIYKYFIGTLILSVEELIVCLVATTLVVSPKLILESIEKFINSKYGNKNES
jgi:hypothetical protein